MSQASDTTAQRSLFKDFFFKVSETFVTRILIMAIALAVSVVIARLLGPAGQGLYATALALGAVGVQFGNLGLSTTNTYLAAKNKGNVPLLLGNSIFVTIVFGFLVVGTIAVVKQLAPSYVPLNGTLLYLAMFWTFPGLLLLFSQSLLLGCQQVRTFNLVEIFQRSIHVFFLAACVTLGMVSEQLLFGFLLLALCFTALFALYKIFHLSERQLPFPSIRLLKATGWYGISAYLAGLFSYLCLRFDLLMLKSMAGSAEAGYYSIAVSLSDVVYTLPVVVGTILFSKLSSLNDFYEKRRFVYKVLLLLGGVMLLGLAVAYYAVFPLLPMLYGEEFRPSIQPFAILLPGIYCLSLSTIVQNFIASVGRSWLMFIGPFIAFALNLPLNLILIPQYGGSGAAMASVASYALWLLTALGILFFLKPKKEAEMDFSVERKDYFLSVYPLTENAFSRMKDSVGRELEVIEISSTVRQVGLAKLFFYLRRKSIETLYIESPEGGDKNLSNILCAFALFSNAKKLVFIESSGQKIIGRKEMLRSVGKVVSSTLAGRRSVRKNKTILDKLIGQERISFDRPVDSSVLFLKANLWFGVKAGGSVGHVAGVVNAFQRMGYPVTCGAVTKPLMIDADVKFVELPFDRSFAYPVEINNYLYSDDINQQLSSDSELCQKSGIIYQRLSLGNFSGVLLSRLWKKPLILEYNGSEVWVSTNWGKKLKFHALADLCERVCLKHAHLIVTVSDVLRDELLEKGIEPHRVVSYPNCIDPKIFNPARYSESQVSEIRKKHDLKESDHVVTFIGTFGKWHGVNVLADTIEYQVKNHKELLDQCNIKFLLVGDGSEMPYVQGKLLTDEIKPYVRFTGLVEQHLAPLYLQASDILVSPHVPNEDGTRFFGSPTKLFEYMAMEKPIIASDLEQLSEIFQGSAHIDNSPNEEDVKKSSALLIRPGSVESFDKALCYLYENKGAHGSLAKNAREKALGQYTWTIHVEKILEAFGRLS